MNIENQVAIVTGAASGIGKAIAHSLARLGAKAVACVDMDGTVQEMQNALFHCFVGDTTDDGFRKHVFDEIGKIGLPTICVPAAGITRDSLAVKFNKETGKAAIYPKEQFQQVIDVNLLAPTYWGMELVARIAEAQGKWVPGSELRGTVVFLGSVSSQGNRGQVAYAASKKALEAVAATLSQEAMFYGVKFSVVHPGFTATPMVQKMPKEIIEKSVLPNTQLKRLLKPEEIADTVCFMISNSGVTREIWVDAGWHPSA